MAYDEGLAQRIRDHLQDQTGFVEKKMFGGLSFLLGGRMAVGIIKDDLVIRQSTEDHQSLLAEPHVRPMDFTGRPMKGWVYVAPEGVEEDAALARWIELGVAHARALGPKPPKAPRTRKRRS